MRRLLFRSLIQLFYIELLKWENDFSSGKSEWSNLNLSKIGFKKMPGVKFEDQKMIQFSLVDAVQRVLQILTSSPLNKITGFRIEAMKDRRLPKGGPGRAPNDGNFVLTELEVTRFRPVKDLKHWKTIDHSILDSSIIPSSWKVNAGSSLEDGNQSVIFRKTDKIASLQVSEFSHRLLED